MKNKRIIFKKVFTRVVVTSLALIGLASCKQSNEETTSAPTTVAPTTSTSSTTTNQEVLVSFDTAGGSGINSQNVAIGSKVIKPDDPTKDGYVFIGWFESNEETANAWDFDNNTISNPVTIYAKWGKVYTVEELLQLCPSTAGETSESRYYVKATVKSIDNATYGGMTIEDETGEISVYGSYGADGEKRYSELDEKPYAGD